MLLALAIWGLHSYKTSDTDRSNPGAGASSVAWAAWRQILALFQLERLGLHMKELERVGA